MFYAFRRWPWLRRAGVAIFILPLMFAGGSLVGDLQSSVGGYVGGVGKFEISQQEFYTVYQQFAEEYRRQYNRQDIPQEHAEYLSRQAQSQLTREYLIRAAAAERGIAASAPVIADEIRRLPDFQDDSGNFSISLFNEYVPNVRELENNVRRTLERRPLLAALQNYPLPAVREKLAAYRRQERVVETAVISVTARFNITEESVRRYYSENQNIYAIREEADWEYILIESEPLAGAPDEETITLARQELEEEYAAAEQRTARHIYIAGEDEDAQARAEDIARRAREAPDSFAELARELSEDEGSAADGGALGIVVRGDLPEAMDDIAFTLEDGEIGGPAAVDGGFSVLKVEFISTPPPDNLDELAVARAREIIARDNLSEKLEKLQETAHINIGSLAKLAAEAGAQIQTVFAVRPVPAPNAEEDENAPPDFFREREILTELYAPEIVAEGETSPPLAIDDDTYIMARALRHQPASVRPLSEVGEEIFQLLNAREQIIKMRADGGGNITPPANLAWEGNYTLRLTGEDAPEGIGDNAINAVFSADLSGGLPAFALLPEAGAIRAFRIRAAKEAPPEEEDLEVIAGLLDETQSAALANAYLETLLDIYDVRFQL